MNCQIEKNNNTATAELEPRSLRRPAYNIDENEHSYNVEVFIPGVSKAGVSVSLEDETLTIHATRNHDRTPDSWKPLRREIADADYRLQLEVNVPVDRDSISAQVEDGVLSLVLPKAEEAKPRQIAIK